MRMLGNKVSARELAQSAGVPVVLATGPAGRIWRARRSWRPRSVIR